VYECKSVDECKLLCLDDPTCMGIEYGVAYGGAGTYGPGDCQLSSSATTEGCEGATHNLDFYTLDTGVCGQAGPPASSSARYPGRSLPSKRHQRFPRGIVPVPTGAAMHEVAGRAVVIHDADGGRVACALLGEGGSLKATFTRAGTKYPGMPADYPEAVSVSGAVTQFITTSPSRGPLTTFDYHLEGLDPRCADGAGRAANSCGIHVHEGTDCQDKSDVGGHFYQTRSDPWKTVAYTAPCSDDKACQLPPAGPAGGAGGGTTFKLVGEGACASTTGTYDSRKGVCTSYDGTYPCMGTFSLRWGPRTSGQPAAGSPLTLDACQQKCLDVNEAKPGACHGISWLPGASFEKCTSGPGSSCEETEPPVDGVMTADMKANEEELSVANGALLCNLYGHLEVVKPPDGIWVIHDQDIYGVLGGQTSLGGGFSFGLSHPPRPGAPDTPATHIDTVTDGWGIGDNMESCYTLYDGQLPRRLEEDPADGCVADDTCVSLGADSSFERVFGTACKLASYGGTIKQLITNLDVSQECQVAADRMATCALEPSDDEKKFVKELVRDGKPVKFDCAGLIEHFPDACYNGGDLVDECEVACKQAIMGCDAFVSKAKPDEPWCSAANEEFVLKYAVGTHIDRGSRLGSGAVDVDNCGSEQVFSERFARSQSSIG
jgi:hypothetical protein